MKTIKIFKSRKKVQSFLMLFLFSQVMMAAGTISAEITSWGSTVKNSLNAAVAVFAVVGGFIIFIQYMQGNEQAQKNFIKFVIGLAIFALSTLIVGVFI